MRVHELIEKLRMQDPEAEVAIYTGRPGDQWATRVVDVGLLYPEPEGGFPPSEERYRRVVILDAAETPMSMDKECNVDPDLEDQEEDAYS